MNIRQWSLTEQRRLKVEKGDPQVPKKAKAKGDGVKNPQNYNFNAENVDALKTLWFYRNRP